MDQSQNRLPNLQLQSPAVDFIENSLDKYHPAFSTPPSQYDPHIGGFVIQNPRYGTLKAVTGELSSRDYSHVPYSALATTDDSTLEPEGRLRITPRPMPKRTNAIEFWDSLFPKAMARFIESHPREPEHLLKLGRGIRDKTNWSQVLTQVTTAKVDCQKDDNKVKAKVRNWNRNFGEHIAEPLARVTKLVPGGGDLGTVAVTPIVGCVQILLEV